MSTEMQLFNAGDVPAHLQRVFNRQQSDDLTYGAEASFPVISIKGKVWRIKQGADERVVQQDGQPLQTLNVVLVKANRNLSKLYYIKPYSEGDDSAPDCSSSSGIAPDTGVPNPQSDSCAACPHNIWGSKITPQGTKTKACSDLRRMAVLSEQDLECKYYGAPFLVRIPAASLQSLSEYARILLNGRPYSAVVTQIGFDMNVAYPKLTFKPTRWLTEAESQVVLRWQNDAVTDRIIGASDLRPTLPAPQPMTFHPVKPVEIIQTTMPPTASVQQAKPVEVDPFSGVVPTQTITLQPIAQPTTSQVVDHRLAGIPVEMISAIMAAGGPDSPAGAIVLEAVRPKIVTPPVDPMAGMPEPMKDAVMALGGPDSEMGRSLINTWAGNLTPIVPTAEPGKKPRKPRTPRTPQVPEVVTQTAVVPDVMAEQTVIPAEVIQAPTPAVVATSAQIIPASDDMMRDVDALLAGLDNLSFDDL